MDSCDKLEESAREFPSSCFILLNELHKSEKTFRNALYLGAQQTLCRSPTISACGFYKMNKRTLSTLYSVIVTYIIVIIELDFVLE